MQKLEERNTYTPTDIPHVRSNCGLTLNVGLPKSHINDAFVIAGGTVQERGLASYSIQQVRKCKRKLFKGDRSHIKNTAPRIIKGFQRFDKVLWSETECFIFGRRVSGYFDLRKLDGTKVHACAKVKELKLLENANTLLVELNTIANYRHNWQISQVQVQGALIKRPNRKVGVSSTASTTALPTPAPAPVASA